MTKNKDFQKWCENNNIIIGLVKNIQFSVSIDGNLKVKIVLGDDLSETIDFHVIKPK